MNNPLPEKKREQRITLCCEGSPVKFTGTVISTTHDGKHIIVRFDGPHADVEMYAFGTNRLISDMKGQDGEPVTDPRMVVKATYWKVL